VSIDRLVDARASGVIMASGAIERRIAELRGQGHDENAAARIAFEEASPRSAEETTRALQERTVFAMQLNRSLGVKRKGGRMARAPWIDAIEVDYASAIVGVVDGWRDEFADAARELPRLIALSNARRDADEPVTARRILAIMREKMEGEVNKRNLSAMAKYFGERTNREQRAALSKQLTRALGVEVIPDDRWIPEMVEYFANENAELIGSIPRRLHDDVAQLTMRAFTKRMNPETFARELEERFNVARSRARLIARDQLGSLYGQLNQTRQSALGITHFFWETRRDSLVRPEHRRRQGQRYAWSEISPSEVPGAPIACRCGAIPDLSTLLAMYKKQKKRR
jgi:SPP1 gp7 family putative phage head morphogenesis protein